MAHVDWYIEGVEVSNCNCDYAEHRVRISLPNGIEFDIAEIASGTTKTIASIALDLKDSYFHFNTLRQSGKGVVR